MSRALSFHLFSYLTFYVTELYFIEILSTEGHTQRNVTELAF